ncbi:Protein of unknown function [Bacillus wiedmannii]|uniref:Uncharacterized protein n=1 Tax=Bacillus wiedmannii TaxID=1890302 RepID=A0AB37Z1V3_9BACI|nr:Protein of unknown function [Bacillus wiedmannii]
MSTANSVA